PSPFGQPGLWSARRLEPSWLVPTEHPQRPERIPPAWLTHGFAERKGERLVVCGIKEPSTVDLPPVLDDVQSIRDARVWLKTCVSKVVERTKDVVAIAGWEGERQERPIRGLAGREPTEQGALEQVLFASPFGRRDLRRGSDGTLVLEQPFQHADR